MPNIKDSRVIKAGVGYLIGNCLVKGMAFFSLPLFTRLMTPENFGLYSIYLSYEAIIVLIIGLALHSSIKNAYYDFKENFNAYIASCTSMMILVFFLCLFLAAVFIQDIVVVTKFKPLIIYCLIFHGFAGAIFAVYNVYLSIFYEYKKFVIISFINTVFNIVLSIALMLFVFQDNTYIGRILGTVIPYCFMAVFIIYLFYKKNMTIFSPKYWKYGIGYSLPIVLHGMSQVGLGYANRIIIQNFFGDFYAGIFSFSFILNTIFLLIINSLENSWSPWFYEKLNDKDYFSIRKRYKQLLYGMTIVLNLLLFFAPELIAFLAPDSYSQAIYTAVPLCISAFFIFLYKFPAEVEYFFGKTRSIAFATIIAALLNVGVSLYIGKYVGYIGIAYVNLAAYILYYLFHRYLANKILNTSIFSNKDTIVCISMSLIMAVGVLNIERLVLRSLIMLIIISYIGWENKNLIKSFCFEKK